MHIIVYGNPIDGLSFIGPFANGEEAVSLALHTEEWRHVRNDTWWVASLQPSPSEK